MKTILDDICKAYNLFEDDFSKEVFGNRILIKSCYSEYICNPIEEIEDEFLFQKYQNSDLPEVEQKWGKSRKFVVCGAGKKGQATYRSLKHAGYEVVCFVDNSPEKIGTVISGIPVISFVDLCIDRDLNYVAVIANNGYGSQFYSQLEVLGYPKDNIYLYSKDILINVFDVPYFGIKKHQKGTKEIFVDCGALNGETCYAFMQWCDYEYEKIYAFEALEGNSKLTKANLEKYDRIEVINKAVGKENGWVGFEENISDLGGSKVSDNDSGKQVKVTSIDETLKGDRCTFIKMDIEGSEYDALCGAKDTIVKHKPMLAISCYHLQNDLIRIPVLIKSFREDYKLYLRHHTNTVYDLVLYAI